jgi:hypothetical protein
VQVIVEVIPPGGQTSAKLLKLKSMARQNKKHWDKLENFVRFIRQDDKQIILETLIDSPNSVHCFQLENFEKFPHLNQLVEL